VPIHFTQLFHAGDCLQEALFQLQLQQAEAGAKHCTGLVGSQGQVLGQDPPSPSTVKRLKAARQAALGQHQKDTQEAATHRCVACTAAALCSVSAYTAAMMLHR
jgi:hypothetical protein